MLVTRVALLISLEGLTSWGLAAAQCPDGTPPPCRQIAAAPARRANPPLDARTWIVLPFENQTRTQDIEWLREASVNLLYLDMSKWRDIRVIDDERVADLMRDLPAAQRERLGLESGLALARRAGAGKLVMGDLLKVGSRTRVVAKIFDVRSGERIRNVQEEASSADSLMPAFTRLAQGILDVPAGESASLSAVGTTRLDAYQEYVAGVTALSSWNLTDARTRFARALELDSTFALAHYKLSVVTGWSSATDPSRRVHARAAARLSGALPARERALVNGHLAQAEGHWGQACETYATLLRGDSSDVEAWYNLGECSFHDNAAVPASGDTTRLVFRGSWNTALAAFDRALDLDPTYHLAFQHIPDILQAPNRFGCRVGESDACREPVNAIVRRAGDSLVTQPVMVATAQGGAELMRQADEARRSGARRDNLRLARDIAQRWVQAGPTEPRARLAYGRSLLRLGDVAGAAQQFAQVPTAAAVTTPELLQYGLDRVEVLLKQGRAADASRLVDSVRAILDTLDTVPQARQGAGLIAAIFGRPQTVESLLGTIPAPPPIRRQFAAGVRVLVGLPVDSLGAIEGEAARALGAGSSTQAVAQAVAIISPTLMLGLRNPRPGGWPPVLDTLSRDERLALVAVYATGDTARLRGALARFDSLVAALPPDAPDAGRALLSAEAHLALADTGLALERLVAWERDTWPSTSMLDQLGAGFDFLGLTWGRTFLLMGDLAMAQRQPEVARRAYGRVVGMWADAEPPLQPAVERARQALAQLN